MDEKETTKTIFNSYPTTQMQVKLRKQCYGCDLICYKHRDNIHNYATADGITNVEGRKEYNGISC
jgi:hypothetical protein